MRKIIRKINNFYMKIYKNNPAKTKRSRYLYGKEIYNDLDDKEKSRIRRTIKQYCPKIKIKSRKYRKISRDLAFSKKHYKCANNEYFMFDFWHKSDKKRKTFITGIKKREYIHMLNTDESIEILKDKYATYELFRDLYKRDVIEINNEKDYKKYEEFIKKHPRFIKKSNNLACGKSIEIIKIKEDNKKDIFDNFLEESNSTILEELVIQSSEMSELHPESVNTVRIITFLDEDGSIKIKYPFLRVGVGSSIVDNGGAGGIICLIDENTGIVIADGVDEECNFYKIHPDTGIKIKGFQIPEWEEACNLAKKAQKLMKDARLVGWDLAYTSKGWVIIEGNGHTQFIGQQISDQIGKKEPFEEMINYEKLKEDYEAKTSKYEFSVVIPVYNCEKYLKDAIDSVINQTIGFEENIELILVNDGSTDGTDEICKNYKEKYPNNIKYIYQKNQGVSFARNEGKKHVTGKYVNFLDADDKWAKDAFQKVKDFFEQRNTRIDMVTCRQKFFEAKTGYANLDYKFKEAKDYIVNINKNPEYFTLSVSSTFFKTNSLKGHDFDTRLNYGEDAKLITEIILEKGIYGLVKNAVFYLRKRNDNTSLTQNSKTDITKYTNTMNYYYKYLIDLSKEKYGFVIPYVQHVVINGLKYRISNQIPDDIDEKIRKEYINTIIELLQEIEDAIIIDTRNVNLNIKYYILKQKYNDDNNKNCIINSEKDVIYKDKKIGNLTGNKKLYLSSINIFNNKITLRGIYKFPLYIDTAKVYIELNNKKYDLSFEKTKEFDKLSFKDEIITEVKNFKLDIDNIKDVNKIKAYFEMENIKIPLNIELEETSFLKNINKNYIKIKSYMITKSNDKALIIKKYSLSRAIKHKIINK